jgi:hypothetical protein
MMVVHVSPRVAELHRIWSAVAGGVTAGYVLLQLLGRGLVRPRTSGSGSCRATSSWPDRRS